MKKNLITFILVVALVVIGIIAYFLSSSANHIANEYFPFRTEKQGRWGIIKYDGTIIFEDEFVEKPLSPQNGRFFIKNEDNTYTIYTLEAHPRPVGEDYIDIAPFTAKVTPATTEGKPVTLIDKNGKVVKTMDKISNYPITKVSEFSYGYAGVCIEKDDREQYGIINTKGEVVIQPAYGEVLILADAFIAYNDAADKFTLMNYGGKVLFEANVDKYSDIKVFDNYICFEKSNGKWEIFNHKGKLIDDNFPYEMQGIVGDIVIYKKSGNYGLMKLNGEMITRNKYDILVALGEDRFMGLVDDKVECLDKNGNVLVKFDEIEDATLFVEGKIFVEEGDHNWVLMNTNFEDLKHQNLYKVYEIETESLYRKRCKWVYSDWSGEDDQLDEIEVVTEVEELVEEVVAEAETEDAYAIAGRSYGVNGRVRTFTVNGVSFDMITVEGGTFTMGATSEQGSDAWDDEKPAHQVTLSTYSIGKTEVTQALWKAVMGTNPSNFKGDNLPVESVSWDDCQEFIQKLNALTGQNFRLPTEAEWEFAARGGKKSKGYKYAGSNNLSEVAWYDEDLSSGSTHPVGTKRPNELGIYDMSGNVWEWCQDWYGSYSSSPQTNPTGPTSGSYRVYRGGSWSIIAGLCRVSYRFNFRNPNDGDYVLGFRLCL